MASSGDGFSSFAIDIIIIITIIIIIIIIHHEVQQVSWFSLTKNSLFTVVPKTSGSTEEQGGDQTALILFSVFSSPGTINP